MKAKTFWTKNDIYDSLNGIVEDNYLDLISQRIFDFIMKADDYDVECGASFDEEFNPVEEFIEGTLIGVDIQDVENGRLGLTIHMHVSGKPFPSKKDINSILKYNSKYNIIYAPVGLILVKNNLNERISLPDEAFESYSKKSDEINKKIRDEKRKSKLEARERYVVDIDKYVSNHIKKHIKENGENYTNQLNVLFDDDFIEIKFVSP